MADLKRREFLKNTTLAAGAASLVGPAAWAGANNRINVAVMPEAWTIPAWSTGFRDGSSASLT